MPATRRRFLSDLWTLTKPYWRSEERFKSGLLLAVIIGMSLGIVYLNVLFNEWNNLFYNSLQEKNVDDFFGCSAGSPSWPACSSSWPSTRSTCARCCRSLAALAHRPLRRKWLEGRNYYRLRFENGTTDNPDQRISEDIGGFVEQTLSLTPRFPRIRGHPGLLFRHPLAAFRRHPHPRLQVPGSMLWAAVLYAGFGSLLTHYIGRPLIRLNFFQQRYEADFRYTWCGYGKTPKPSPSTAARPRRPGDWPAVSPTSFPTGGDHAPPEAADLVFRRLFPAAVIFPFLVAAPRYFSGAIQLGGLMQTVSAFGHVSRPCPGSSTPTRGWPSGRPPWIV